MQIIEPVVIRPWLAEWEEAKTPRRRRPGRGSHRAGSPAPRGRTAVGRLSQAAARLHGSGPRLRLGNFLYLALQALKDLEHRVQLEAEALGLERGFPETGPANVKGIEINPYAAELARVSVWIGEIQWMRRNGFTGRAIRS